MQFILIIFLYTNMSGGPVGFMHKKFTSLEACQSALETAKARIILRPNTAAAGKCVSVDDLLELNRA